MSPATPIQNNDFRLIGDNTKRLKYNLLIFGMVHQGTDSLPLETLLLAVLMRMRGLEL